MFCTNCGKEIRKESKFCEHCGEAIKIGNVASLNNATKDSYKKSIPKIKKYKTTKKLLFLLFGFVIIFGMGMFVNTMPSEKEKKDLIAEYEGFNLMTNPMKITYYKEYDLGKNNNNTKQIVAEIIAKNDYAEYTRGYLLTLRKVDGKWECINIDLNDRYENTINIQTKLTPINDLSNEDIKKSLLHSDLVEKYSITTLNIETEIPLQTDNSLEKEIKAVLEAENEYASFTFNMIFDCYFDWDLGWECSNYTILDENYKPKFQPDKSLTKVAAMENGDAEIELIRQSSENEDEYIHTYLSEEKKYQNVSIKYAIDVYCSFDPISGWTPYKVEKYPEKIMSIDLNGIWKYTSGRDYININVLDVGYKDALNEIVFDIDYHVYDTNILSIGDELIEFNKNSIERFWYWKYDKDENCIVFYSDIPIFTLTYSVGFKDEESLEYIEYLGESTEKTGFYVGNKQLVRQ